MVMAELCRDSETDGQELSVSSTAWREEGEFIDVIKWWAAFDQPIRGPQILHEWMEEHR